MANLNGLISSRDVAATGKVASNFFVRKGEAIQSPLLIKSSDGTQTAGIYCNNNGNMVIASDSDGIMYLFSGDGAVQFYSPNQSKSGAVAVNNGGDMIILPGISGELYLGLGNVYFASPNQTQNAQLVVANNGDTGLYQSGAGSTLFLGGSSGRVALASLDATPVVQIGTQNGTVYDTVYNPTYAISLLNNNTTGNVAYDITATRAAGVYQVQLAIENATPASGTILNVGCTAPPSSAVINFSGAAANAAAIGISQDVCLNTGFFTHAGGDLRVVVSSSGAAWTGTWSLQLIKMG